jgi:hypothetical protein
VVPNPAASVSPDVLVSSGCSKIPQTGRLKQRLISHSSKGWEGQARSCHIQCLARAPFLVHRGCLLTASSHDEGPGPSGGLCVRALLPLMRALLS